MHKCVKQNIIVHSIIQKLKNKHTKSMQTEKAKSSHFDRTRGDKKQIFPTLVCSSPKVLDFNEKKASLGVRSPCYHPMQRAALLDKSEIYILTTNNSPFYNGLEHNKFYFFIYTFKVLHFSYNNSLSFKLV